MICRVDAYVMRALYLPRLRYERTFPRSMRVDSLRATIFHPLLSLCNPYIYAQYML